MLYLTLFKILDCYSPFCLKFRCRSIGHMPIGVPLEPSLYLQPFSRYSASKTRARTHTPQVTHDALDCTDNNSTCSDIMSLL